MQYPCSHRTSKAALRRDAEKQLRDNGDGAVPADDQAHAIIEDLLATLDPAEEKILRMRFGIGADNIEDSCKDRSIRGALLWIWSRISQGLPLRLPRDKKNYTVKELATLLRGSR